MSGNGSLSMRTESPNVTSAWTIEPSGPSHRMRSAPPNTSQYQRIASAAPSTHTAAQMREYPSGR